MLHYLFLFLFLLAAGCGSSRSGRSQKPDRIPVIFDTDANNELDDQHALAYLLLHPETFLVRGITVNATRSGGDMDQHFAEAERVMQLCKADKGIPLLKGANAGFAAIRNELGKTNYDGSAAVDFIIREAEAARQDTLVVIAVGKLTNLALALQKAPGISRKLRIVWLGSNYPEPGEYNQDNDTTALNFVLNTDVPFEMVTVRYGKPSGTDAVRASREEIRQRMAGRGPEAGRPVVGRHGGSFRRFGDYAVNLFEHIELHGNPPSRALFDMAAVAIVRNPSWAAARTIPAPVLVENKWVERPDNPRRITLWENFHRDRIMEDFFETMRK